MDHQQEYNQMMRESNSNQQVSKFVFIAVVAFVLGFGSAWISFKGQKTVVADNNSNADTPTENFLSTSLQGSEGNDSEIVSASRVSFRVLDQAPAKSVFIAEVLTETSVWVVIVENIDGVHGNIIGAGLFDVGESAGVVELLRGTVEGGTYYAVLHHEDSDLTQNRSFDLKTDVPAETLSGSYLVAGVKGNIVSAIVEEF